MNELKIATKTSNGELEFKTIHAPKTLSIQTYRTDRKETYEVMCETYTGKLIGVNRFPNEESAAKLIDECTYARKIIVNEIFPQKYVTLCPSSVARYAVRMFFKDRSDYFKLLNTRHPEIFSSSALKKFDKNLLLSKEKCIFDPEAITLMAQTLWVPRGLVTRGVSFYQFFEHI